MRSSPSLLRGLFVGLGVAFLASPARAQLNVTGVEISTADIQWTWNSDGSASYTVTDLGTGQAVQGPSGTTGVVTTNAVIEHAPGMCLNNPGAGNPCVAPFIPFQIPNSSHSIVVTSALGSKGTSATFYTMAMPPAAPTAPTVGLSYNGTANQVVLNWTANGNPGALNNIMMYLPTIQELAPVNQTIAGILAVAALTYAYAPQPNTTYSASVQSEDGDYQSDGQSPRSISGAFALQTSAPATTLTTPPAQPGNLAITGTTANSISVSWTANNNPGDTAYRVQYTPVGGGATQTAIAFSAGYTGLTATVSGLNTGVSYNIQVDAQDRTGTQTSAPAVVTGFPGTAGASGFTESLGAGAGGSFAGTVKDGGGNFRQVTLQVNGGAFAQGVTLTVAPNAAAPGQCGVVAGPDQNASLTITPSPLLQPASPITFSFQVLPGDGFGNSNTLTLSRYDAAAGTCVPLPTVVDAAAGILTAQTNHLSTFIVQQVSPSTSLVSRRVFPNPLYLNTQGYMTFDRLPANARVRIYTLHGEQIFDQRANASGMVLWPATNGAGQKVAGGLYIAVLESDTDRHTMKLVVIR